MPMTTYDLVFGRDEMMNHIALINYHDSLITFNPLNKTTEIPVRVNVVTMDISDHIDNLNNESKLSTVKNKQLLLINEPLTQSRAKALVTSPSQSNNKNNINNDTQTDYLIPDKPIVYTTSSGLFPMHFVMFQLMMIILICQYSFSYPELGPLLDCSNSTKLGVYTIPKTALCTSFHVDDIRHFSAEMKHYEQQVATIRMFVCTTESVVLNCKEFFSGVNQKSMNTIEKHITYEICSQAVRYKNTPSGKINKSPDNQGISAHTDLFKYKLLQTTYVSSLHLKIRIVFAELALDMNSHLKPPD